MVIPEDQVEVLKADGAINAEPIVAALRANGIPATVVGEAVSRLFGLSLDGLGVVSIVVPRKYEEQARALLAAGELHQLEIREDDKFEG